MNQHGINDDEDYDDDLPEYIKNEEMTIFVKSTAPTGIT